MRKLGYSNKCVYFIKIICKFVQADVSSNGFLCTSFSLYKRVQQGCPLSLLLNTINGEVVNLNTRTNDKIVGYTISNQTETLKLSEFATGSTVDESKTAKTILANAKITIFLFSTHI